ncbi:MAG: hypothetical protein F6K47_37115 [Symploca sp. SIO2E6]|nr:hypothetical protein [Symploca sp. SIO2E6]
MSSLLAQLPFEAQARFYSLVLGGSLPPAAVPPLEVQVESLSREEKRELIKSLVDAIVREPGSEQKPTQKVRDLATL